MSEDDNERGVFKQLVLVVMALWVWFELKAEQAYHSETFCWWVAGVAVGVAVFLMVKLIVR